MKKFYSFLVAAVLLMGATSCQKEATVDTGAAGAAEFVASIAGGRTELGDGNKVMWNDSDNIRIFTQENYAGTVFNSNIEEEITATAKFTADNFTASDNGYLAVYPETANTGNATCENGVWSVPVTMSGWDGNPANYPFAFEKNAFMASFSNDNQLAFKAATAILKIKNVDNSWGGEIRFTGDVLGGAATLHYNPNNAENPISYTLGSGDSSVLYNFPEQNGETIYVPIYPGTVTGFEVYGDDWQNPLVTYNKTITFEAGVIYDLDLDNAGIGGGNNSPYSLFNGMEWIPMTIENGYHVAKNVPFAEWGYWIAEGQSTFYEVSGNVTLSAWMELVQGMNTGIIFEAEMVDFYMTEDASMLCIVPAGTSAEKLPALPTYEPSPYILFNLDNESTVSMIIKDGYHFAKNVENSESGYAVMDASGTPLGFTAEWADPCTWYKSAPYDGTKVKGLPIMSYSYMPASVYLSADAEWLCVTYPGYELPALPAKSDWGMLGSYQGWNQENLTPMYVASDWDGNEYAVAYGVNLPANAAFKFKSGDTWKGNANTAVSEGWNYTGDNDIKVSAAGIYDIYLKPDGSLFTILPAGSAIPSAPEFETITITAYNYAGWADNKVNVYAFGGGTTLSNVWPGTAMTATSEGVLTAELSILKGKAPATVKFIFNNGSAQTADSQEFAYATSYTLYFTASTVLTEAPKTNKVRENCLYLKPNSNWTTAGAKFVALFCNGTKGEKWIPMTKVGDNGYYEVEIPGTLGSGKEYKNVLFLRVDPSKTTYNWNNGSVWNQTNDLTVATGKNAYTVTEGAWSKGGGTWSTITEY